MEMNASSWFSIPGGIRKRFRKNSGSPPSSATSSPYPHRVVAWIRLPIRSTLLASGNGKSMSEDVKTYDSSLGDPVYTTSCEHSRQEREDAMNAQHFDVLIIGAGLSGIGQACQGRAALPNKTIAILERRERLGGT